MATLWGRALGWRLQEELAQGGIKQRGIGELTIPQSILRMDLDCVMAAQWVLGGREAELIVRGQFEG